ncbi:tetratricopeptide repeat protein [Lewinella sp. IMCC34183]|uniref:tetratricopeptide repeat protein n=1 Tax=Lewinella sp. IMCC34183 TaxID=2248762 RepID=UPI000E2485F0|nr:tetratricopeptide repeat protein [Lewinella sp. IMCC34183]
MTRKEQILQLLEAAPQDAFLRFALAKEWEKEGNDPAALNIYHSLVNDQPDYVGTYYHLGKTLERMERPREAWKIYTRGMEVTGRLQEQHAKRELAGARLELGDEEDFA